MDGRRRNLTRPPAVDGPAGLAGDPTLSIGSGLGAARPVMYNVDLIKSNNLTAKCLCRFKGHVSCGKA